MMTSLQRRTVPIGWFVLGGVPALVMGLILGPLVGRVFMSRTLTTVELLTLGACLAVGLIGTIGGWFAASAFHRRRLAHDLETVRSWIELVGSAGFEPAHTEPPTSPTLRNLLPCIERAADQVQTRLDSARERTHASEKKAAELTRAQDEIEQVYYIITHHLQEPLIRVTTYLDMFGRQTRGKLDPPALRFLHSVHAGIKRIEALIDDLTLYARSLYAPPDLYETDTSAIVKSVIESLDIEVIESGAKITVGALPIIWASPDALTKVFKHLIGNAIRFRRTDAPEIQVAATRTDGETVFTVTDNGIGIDPVYQRELFSVFERVHTSAAYVGSGIGLAVCKKVVEHHGGRIEVESTPGAGSAFRFSIPDRGGRNHSRTTQEKQIH